MSVVKSSLKRKSDSLQSSSSVKESSTTKPTKPTKTTKTMKPTKPTKTMKTIKVYTDGACQGNQFKKGAKAGVGVFFGDGDSRNISERLKGLPQTNNRAELTALIKAISTAGKGNFIIAYTDSQYCKNGIESWIKNWKKNGWKTSKKKPVKNQDLWIKLDELIQSHNVEFKWVKAHNGNYGNEQADTLAVAGCAKPYTE
jgi:ribonuclease HI